MARSSLNPLPFPNLNLSKAAKILTRSFVGFLTAAVLVAAMGMVSRREGSPAVSSPVEEIVDVLPPDTIPPGAVPDAVAELLEQGRNWRAASELSRVIRESDTPAPETIVMTGNSTRG